MRRLSLVLWILALLLPACAPAGIAEPPTPEAVEVPTQAPEEEPPAEVTSALAEATPTPAAEVAFEGETTVSEEGASASGVLSVESLGVGTVDATAPTQLELGQTGTVRVEIAPLYDPDEVQVETYVTVTAVEDPVEVLNFYDELRLYSIMSAEISAPGFDVETATPTLQRLSGETPALWVWNVIPREAGRRSVTVSISVPIIIDGEVQEISTSPLRTIEFIIEVLKPPSPTPTETPLPTQTPLPTATPLPTLTPTPTPDFIARTMDEAGPEIVAAILLGLLGAVGSFLWSRIRRKDEKGQNPGE